LVAIRTTLVVLPPLYLWPKMPAIAMLQPSTIGSFPRLAALTVTFSLIACNDPSDAPSTAPCAPDLAAEGGVGGDGGSAPVSGNRNSGKAGESNGGERLDDGAAGEDHEVGQGGNEDPDAGVGAAGENGAAGDAGAAGQPGAGGAGGQGSLGCEDGELSLPFVDVEDLPAPGAAAQLIYAPSKQALVLRNAASAINVIDLRSGENLGHLANERFTDISLSPDGRYVFAADYGGENIGYGTPLRQSYVHRLDLEDGSWVVKKSGIAGNIEAVDANRFVLKSSDQWVTFTLNSWGQGIATTQLSASFSFVYYGDFELDWRTGRLIHGNSGSSSQEIQAVKIVGDQFVAQEGTGTYGSASGFGGTAVLATDGSAFYYGTLRVDAQDVSHTLGVFPELVFAATGSLAFGNGSFYDVQSRDQLGELGFATSVYGLNPHGADFWTFDAGSNKLRHFVPTRCVSMR
jgi:hypothetical protein